MVDLNRGEDDPTLVMKLSDGSLIPGNARIDDAETARRIAAFHAPYHAAIAGEIDAMDLPVLISIHSFTRVEGREAALGDRRLVGPRRTAAKPLIAECARAGFVVGDNEPYDGELENDCLYRHGTMRGLPHVADRDPPGPGRHAGGGARFAARLTPILERALAAMGPSALEFTRPLGLKGTKMDEKTRLELEAAAFRRLVAHLRGRTDVQNIDLMNLAGFCRNCLGDWYREAAAEKGSCFRRTRRARSSTACRRPNGRRAIRKRRRRSSRRRSPRPRRLTAKAGGAVAPAGALSLIVLAFNRLGTIWPSPASRRNICARSSSVSSGSRKRRRRSPTTSAKSTRGQGHRLRYEGHAPASSACAKWKAPTARNRKRCSICI
ncbi:MAG: DUF1244 domain-containing protein [Rhizomicrobium sp.]